MSLLEGMRDAQLKVFKRYWAICPRQGYIRHMAERWTGLESVFVGDQHLINALRAAGAFVHIHGIDSDGDWAFEVTNWRDFNRGVFSVMGISDPRDNPQFV